MNNNKSLYAMWLEAHKNGTLPVEWRQAHNFLTWATENRYKTEYGYKGEFTPYGLKLAIPGAMVVGVDLASGPDKHVISYIKDAESLVKTKKLDKLKKLAADMGVVIGGATTKKEIAMLIVKGVE